MDKSKLKAGVHTAGAIFSILNPQLPVNPEHLQAAAKEAGLPELRFPNDRLAVAIFLAGCCAEHEDVLDVVIDDVYKARFQSTMH